jgi:hypothetical protein
MLRCYQFACEESRFQVKQKGQPIIFPFLSFLSSPSNIGAAYCSSSPKKKFNPARSLAKGCGSGFYKKLQNKDGLISGLLAFGSDGLLDIADVGVY